MARAGDQKEVPDDDLEKGNELVNLGAESLSGLAGAAAGLSFGPPGALIGATVGPAATRIIRWAGREMRARLLSSKEELRIAGALVIAIQRIDERRSKGDKPRDDGYFDPETDPRGLLEGSLLTAARSYDEQKIPFIGAFYASFAFDSDVSVETGHFLLHLLDRLTFRQLCALSYFADPATRAQQISIQNAAQKDGDRTSPALAAELGELSSLGLLGVRQEDGHIVNPLATFGGASLTAANLANSALTPLGERLSQMSELSLMSKKDKDQIAEALAGVRS